jgi:DNA-binding CsgD family transcriptional regulator
MRGVEERAVRLLELLFRAPGDLRLYWEFQEALAREMSHDVCAVSLVESLTPAPATAVFGPGFQHVAPGLLPMRGTQRRRGNTVPVGAIFDVPPWSKEFRRSALVRTLFEPEGILPGPGIGVVLVTDEKRVAAVLALLPRREGWVPTAADRALLASLAPFLPIAARLHRQIVGQNALTSILDYLVLGVILLDDRGRVTYANRSAAEVLGVEPGLSMPGRSRRDARTEALYRTVAREGPDELSVYRHPVDGRALQVMMTGLVWPDPVGGEARNFTRAIFIGDPKLSSGDPIQNFGEAYGFTKSETKLAWLLAGDLTLAEAAAQLDITQNTARTVLKRILAKTGTNRQASLVRLLWSGPAQLRAARPSGSPLRARPRRRSPPSGGGRPSFGG